MQASSKEPWEHLKKFGDWIYLDVWGPSRRSISGCTSMWEASPVLDNWATSPVWARDGSGAVRHEDGPAVHVGCPNGRVDDAVIEAVNHGHLRAAILSFRSWTLSSHLSIQPCSLASVSWHDFNADLRPAASSVSSFYSFKARLLASLLRSCLSISHAMVTALLTACRGRSVLCSLQAWMTCAM
jgi:hypothetical protein